MLSPARAFLRATPQSLLRERKLIYIITYRNIMIDVKRKIEREIEKREKRIKIYPWLLR